jgi:hypothetical protein
VELEPHNGLGTTDILISDKNLLRHCNLQLATNGSENSFFWFLTLNIRDLDLVRHVALTGGGTQEVVYGFGCSVCVQDPP